MKCTNGTICLYSVSPDFQPNTPAHLDALAQQHGVPVRVVPAYAGDRAMVTRAISRTTAAARQAGWLVQALDTSKERVVYTIARMDKDKERERADFAHTATIKWASDAPDTIEGWHEVAQQVHDEYRALRGLVLAGDWTKTLIDYITGPCQGIALKDNGGAWWVPPQGTAKLTALRAMLKEVGIAVYVSEIDPDNVGDIQQVAQQGLTEQIAALQDEVAGFDGSQAPGVYRGRLTQLREIRAKALAYHGAVGLHLDDLTQVLSAVDAQLDALLTTRLDTVIHKDGTRETVLRTDLDAQRAAWDRIVAGGEQAMAQALLDGTVTVDCTDADLDWLREVSQPEGPDAALQAALDATTDLPAHLAEALRAPAAASDLPRTW